MVNILLDTDIGSDCDDAGALALLHKLRNQKQINIVGITHSNEMAYGPAVIRIINKFYGFEDEIGVYEGASHPFSQNFDTYAKKLVFRFDENPLQRSECKNAVRYMRERLAKLNGKCKIVCIGLLDNVFDLLESDADDISNLSGYSLVKEKVDEFVVMAGMFNKKNEQIYFCNKKYESEYNLTLSGKKGVEFIKNCPIKITFCDFLLGYKIMTLGHIIENWQSDPVAFAYKEFANGDRQSWDLIAVLYATFGLNNIFNRTEWGEVNINDLYQTTFIAGGNKNRSYLKLAISESQLEKIINGYF